MASEATAVGPDAAARSVVGAGLRPAPAMLRRRLSHLLVARLALCLAILGIALGLTAHGDGETTARAERGVYATVVFAFAATIGFALWHRRTRREVGFGAVQVATDVGIVTSLVWFTGGSESIFAFLYIPITVYAALLLGRRGAYGASTLAAVGYGGLLLAPHFGWLPVEELAPAPGPVRVALFGVHAGALLLVALLASALSRERDRAGRALDERTRDLRSLQRIHERTVESLTSGLLTTDPQQQITSFNPEAERITGASAAEAIGRPLEEVIPGAAALGVVVGGGRLRRRLRFRNRAGRDLHLGIAGSVLRAAEGGPGGHVVIFQDVTEVVKMEAALRRHERLAGVGQLAADLAHEIRNPLAAISGSIQVLEGSLPRTQDDETRKLIGIAVREADRLNALITDFLRFARPAPANPEPTSVATVAEEVLRMFDAVCPASVHVSLDVPRDLHVRADEGQLRQLLWNLFLNAVQAMPEGGALDVTAAPAPPQARTAGGRNAGEEGACQVEIEVADTGCGIPEEVLDRIFDPFFTTKKDGSGLGLATVHRIVEGHGGQLTVESRVGRGTRFRIRLPRAEAA
jgi:two-component system sensor histidine kinase PilS (NtrC family)